MDFKLMCVTSLKFVENRQRADDSAPFGEDRLYGESTVGQRDGFGYEKDHRQGAKAPRNSNAAGVILFLLRVFAPSRLLLICLFTSSAFAQDAPKSKVAVFPLSGDAKETFKERVAFSLRSKLDRDGAYEAISGVEMNESVARVDKPVTFDSKSETLEPLVKSLNADVLIWGDLSAKGDGATLKVRVFDLRQLDPLPFEITQPIDQPTDVRFVSEKILEHLAGVKKFAHPTEEAVTHDATADALWKSNPNLVVNGDFAEPGHWEGVYQSERYTVKSGSALPEQDNVRIYSTLEADGTPNRALAMNLSKVAAENNGLAALSEPVKIEKGARYRLSFKYLSDGPKLHVFVKGYTLVPDGKGGAIEREVYRRQVPPTGATDGKWVTVVDDLNPQHVTFPVQLLRVDLYAYLNPGLVLFDDVVLKAVGARTRDAGDAAIDAPVTRPTGRPTTRE
jgi:hypothetical protein